MSHVKDDPTTLFYKEVGGAAIVVTRMIFNARISIGPANASYYDDGWCYANPLVAMQAAAEWDGEGDPPDGWHRHVSTGRRRTDGDPSKEYVSP